jgi:hypothetical protein
MRSMKIVCFALFLGAPWALTGCIYVKTHSTIEPIHMTLDVNLKVQLEKELTDVFGDIDAASSTVNPTAAP